MNKSKINTEDKISEKTDRTNKINNDSESVTHEANIEKVALEKVENIKTSSIEEKK